MRRDEGGSIRVRQAAFGGRRLRLQRICREGPNAVKNDRDESRTVTLQVQRLNGQWETVFGGEAPVREGALAELTLPMGALRDSEFKRLLNQELLVKVLDEGTELQVAIAGAPASVRAHGGQHRVRVPARYWPGDSVTFVPVRIGPPNRTSSKIDPDRGGLWMRHVGLDRCEMVSSSIVLPPGPGREEAISPNHAYTVLSERYEVHRISHTGNVYERVFFQESDEHWYPMSGLRDGVRERSERRILARAWATIEAQLGWCRLPPHPDSIKPRKREGDE
ncbi:MAG: hypothetical protein KIT60_05395 [Burkholderiaceae bacterium]|nr:hypothetical protein [Burkholderiaceae bacterium]